MDKNHEKNGSAKTDRAPIGRSDAVKKIIRVLEQLPSDIERARVGELVAELTQMPAERA